MEEKLVLSFVTGMGKSFKLTLDNPRSDLIPDDVEAAMNLIIEKDIFAVEGGVTAIDKAEIVTTETTELVFA